MSRLFDTVVAVDWSARSTPSPARPSADAIWFAVARDGLAQAPAYCRTRAEALARLTDLLATEVAAGRRTLAGFDFPFGYPRGFAAQVVGAPDALRLWDWMARAVEDGPGNANNRFAVAGRLNALFPGIGPFWGRPATIAEPGLPERGGARAGHGLPERRLAETRAPGAQTCWKLYTTGSVGSQALTGIAALARLRADPRLAGAARVWPFETGLAIPDAPVTLAEIYPSLLADEVRARAPGDSRDAAQVRLMAQRFADLDAAGGLAALFGADPALSPSERVIVAREEGWILGVGHEAALRPPAPAFANDCFTGAQGAGLTPVGEARARLRAAARCVCEPETIPLAAASGRILARDAVALRAHPPAPNAAVDGYAFAHDAMGEGVLALHEGRAAAGAPYAHALPRGAALRILTGATIPEGADTVAMQEDVAVDADAIRFAPRLGKGANVRPAGENLTEGAVAAPAGRALTPADLAQIAAGGLGAVTVRRRLRVGVLSTGDEIAEPGAATQDDAIPDSNRPMLCAMLARMGFEPVDLGIAQDNAAAARAALDRGAALADAVVTSGGASAGDEDHMSRILRESGALSVWRVAMKPGRPLALGIWRGRPVFGLPGNPVAAFVCALIFARPALCVMAGAPWPEPRALRAPAAFARRKMAGRREYLRARLDAQGRAEVFHAEGSGLIGGLAWAEGLVELADDVTDIAEGDPVAFLPYASFGL